MLVISPGEEVAGGRVDSVVVVLLRPSSGNAKINEDSWESWVENSELGQDEGGQTTGTLRVACWSSSIANWNNCLTVMFVLPDSSASASAVMPILVQESREELRNMSEGIGIGGSLTTDELEDGSTGARMSWGTRAEQQLAGGKKSASAPGLIYVGSVCAWA